MSAEYGSLPARLREIIQGLSAEASLETRLRAILSAAAEYTESETASLLEYDETSLNFHHKFESWFQREDARDARISLNGSVAGWVFLNRTPLVIDAASKGAGRSQKADEFSSAAIRSILGVPVSRDKPVGVLEVFNKKTEYTGEDIEALGTLAAAAAAALRMDELERGILASQEEARELDRLKNDFVAITSHELRTPLGLILGHATFLKELVGDKHNEQVDAIIRNASRLKEIIETLTRMDNYQTGGALVRSRQVSVARIIEDVCISFEEMAQKKNIALKKIVQPGQELWVEVDGDKVAIVLGNLLKNAITFTDKGGEVTVRGEKFNDYIKVSVRDDGIGIPAEDLPHVFDRFYQVENHLTRKHGGMGLGLSVAKVMIEMHGGRIWAESEERQGSVFSFILPIRFVPAPAAGPFAE